MILGQLIGKSQKIMQTKTSRFLCQNDECAANQRKHFVDLPFPEKSKNSPRCFFCQSFQVKHSLHCDASLSFMHECGTVQCCSIENHEDPIYVVNWHFLACPDRC